MATWNDLLDAVLDVGKPLTYTIARVFRDNPIAIAEGASGAPRIVPGALNFPYFLATRTAVQSPSGAGSIKIQANTEVYDPDNLYDNVTNYRFTPNKAGLYRVSLYIEAVVETGAPAFQAVIQKNGTSIGANRSATGGAGEVQSAICEVIVQMNGTTDYLEPFVFYGVNTVHTVNNARFFAHAICEI
ncbi:hypothetical protein [Tardiphaga sp.]|uniref:hypothetical protein n=1 Tax=Tardiphaga sp. TaxID=1926292 RepID=UPI0037DA5F30